MHRPAIPIVDLFAGPGGLGEGFSSLDQKFEIISSVEMNPWAHRTLRLRSLCRKLSPAEIDPDLYRELASISDEDNVSRFPAAIRGAWDHARNEALNLTIGRSADDKHLRSELDAHSLQGKDWVLVGGPPCQAYSIAGRVRNKGIDGYDAKSDGRHFLYREYLKIIQEYRPAIFVMENVKGILSSSVDGEGIFHQILTDLSQPDLTMGKPDSGIRYSIQSLNSGEGSFEAGMQRGEYDPRGFTVFAENHGVPQQRHRVFLIGVRNDLASKLGNLKVTLDVSVDQALSGLPRLRSKLSKETDGQDEWKAATMGNCRSLIQLAQSHGLDKLATELSMTMDCVLSENLGTGNNSAPRAFGSTTGTGARSDLDQWLAGRQLPLVLNHEARSHMRSDLARYLFASAFARAYKRSPKGPEDFRFEELRPDHANWDSGKFNDRFRVQLADNPSTTITSHISKDGHYYIHPDPTQCRSLTVREAARLQTFPDDYFFCGPRTHQYTQVGNAVPPFLARQIAMLVSEALTSGQPKAGQPPPQHERIAS